MRLTKTLTLCAALSLLASCVTPNTDGCAGWRKVQASDEAVGWLAAHDPEALKDVISHAEYGKAQGCWK